MDNAQRYPSCWLKGRVTLARSTKQSTKLVRNLLPSHFPWLQCSATYLLMNCARKSAPKTLNGFGHKESHHGHQSGAQAMSGDQIHQYGQTHAYNPNQNVTKPQAECYRQTQQSYYLDTGTAGPGQSYGQAYGQGQHIDHSLDNGRSPCSVSQTHGYHSGHAQNGSHHQESYGMACRGRTEKHKKPKCKNGYRCGGDSGGDCDSEYACKIRGNNTYGEETRETASQRIKYINKIKTA